MAFGLGAWHFQCASDHVSGMMCPVCGKCQSTSFGEEHTALPCLHCSSTHGTVHGSQGWDAR